jgi:hypothetical protein
VQTSTVSAATLFGFLGLQRAADDSFVGRCFRDDAGPLVLVGAMPGVGSEASVSGAVSGSTVSWSQALGNGRAAEGSGAVASLTSCSGWARRAIPSCGRCSPVRLTVRQGNRPASHKGPLKSYGPEEK